MSAPSGYLKFLPGIYAKPEEAFVGQFLKIFEKCLTGLDDGELDGRKGIQQLLSTEVIGNLFYPRLGFLFAGENHSFIPPISALAPAEETKLLAELNSYIGIEATAPPLAGHVKGVQGQTPSWEAALLDWLNGFLIWIGSWVGLVVDQSWSLDKKRTVIAEILALYRLRGTAQGMSFLINLLLDLPLQITGSQYVDGKPEDITGTIAVEVLNPEAPDIRLNDHADQPGTLILRERAGRGMPLVSGYQPWLFIVRIVLPNAANPDFILTGQDAQTILTLQQQLRKVLDAAKPAATDYRIELLPALQLLSTGYASQLSVNAFLGTRAA